MARLSVIVPISVLVIFLLLFDAFKSLRSAALIIANIPFSVIGGILRCGSPASTSRCRPRSASSLSSASRY
jgi:cobalt-zinc-cadmium resistance protein CzcA